MVFDVDNRDSYISLVHWEDEMKRNEVEMNRVKVIVLANKTDNKNREVKEAESSKWAKSRNYDYFEVSANDGNNVNKAFESLFTSCLQQHLNERKQFGLT